MARNRPPFPSRRDCRALIGAVLLSACNSSVVVPAASTIPTRSSALECGVGESSTPRASSSPTAIQDIGRTWLDKSDLPSLQAAIRTHIELAERAAIAGSRETFVPYARAAEGTCLLGEFLNAQSAPAEKTARAFEQGMRFAMLAETAALTPEQRKTALYLTAVNRLGWIRSRGYAEQVEHERALIHALRHLTNSHDNTSLTLASALATAHDAATRDLAAARSLLEKRLLENPWDLMTRVVLARDYAVAAQDHDLFERELRELVVRTSGTQANPLIRVIAARHAHRLLRLAPSLFE